MASPSKPLRRASSDDTLTSRLTTSTLTPDTTKPADDTLTSYLTGTGPNPSASRPATSTSDEIETETEPPPHFHHTPASDAHLARLFSTIDEIIEKYPSTSPPPPPKRWRSLSDRLGVYVLLLVLLLSAIAYILMIAWILTPTKPYFGKRFENCGGSQGEARRRGCVFDPVGFVWVRRECFNGTAVDEFLASLPKPEEGETHWALSSELTALEDPRWVGEEEVREGKFDQGWVTWEYHVRHCAWTWEKLVNEVQRGGAVDGYVAELGHARHCASMMMDRSVDGGEWNSRWDVEFPDCWI